MNTHFNWMLLQIEFKFHVHLKCRLNRIKFTQLQINLSEGFLFNLEQFWKKFKSAGFSHFYSFIRVIGIMEGSCTFFGIRIASICAIIA